MLDPDLIREIEAGWDAAQRHFFQGRVQRGLGKFPVLKQFIEICFLASIGKEEGRPVRFACTLASEAELQADATVPDPRGNIWPSDIRKLDTPVQFSVPNLVKLAPSIDPRLGSLAVAADDHDQLLIWGSLAFEPLPTFFTDIRAGGIGKRFWRPQFLTVMSSGPAALSLTRQDLQIGRLRVGKFEPATLSPFQPEGILAYWNPLAAREAKPISDAVPFTRILLEALLGEMQRRTHGGTVVVLDPQGPVPETIEQRYHVTGASFLAEELTQLARDRPGNWTDVLAGHLGELAWKAVLQNRIKRLAQLATIDGALIITPKFDPIAFGARLYAPTWGGACIVGPASAGARGDFPITHFGMRHKSAADFAGAHPGTMVFIVSQDGPVRAFAWRDEHTVLCWPDCMSSVYV